MKVCILISTCEKYRALLHFTRARLAEFWPGIPPVRVAGIENEPDALELRDDSRNWMKVTRSACEDLITEGFDAAYVLLEDHPPLASCDTRRLAEELPEMMADLGAVSIALSGFGQGRKRLGEKTQWRDWDLDRCLPSTLWKFPLHPALWRLNALRELLDRLIQQLPESEHTPWAFERKGGAPDANLPVELTSHSYRIDGRHKAVAPYPAGLGAMRFATDVFRFAARKLAGPAAREAVDERILGVHHYYHGPYPLLWSGLMRKGKLNPDALYFLRLAGRSDWCRELEQMPLS